MVAIVLRLFRFAFEGCWCEKTPVWVYSKNFSVVIIIPHGVTCETNSLPRYYGFDARMHFTLVCVLQPARRLAVSVPALYFLKPGGGAFCGPECSSTP